MSYERLWERLTEFLNGWAAAAEVVPGRLEVTLPKPDGSARLGEILMTPGEWDEMVTIPWGDFDSAAQAVRTAILALRHHERFLVYGQYELVPSASPDLPVDREGLAQRDPQGFGRWVVTDPTGKQQNMFPPPPD
jgi:hypothetical protein